MPEQQTAVAEKQSSITDLENRISQLEAGVLTALVQVVDESRKSGRPKRKRKTGKKRRGLSKVLGRMLKDAQKTGDDIFDSTSDIERSMRRAIRRTGKKKSWKY
ncbi:hypothetical protein [Nocardia sp. XZ_19_385]|uniref:hypothetical protein n=1 Tax=Nocardia sp. XZ_19_385 TaxID=2769488 RepID=UPI00188EFAF6|nr:hypothetical protein [Nocardia sp. XZ_19_385]